MRPSRRPWFVLTSCLVVACSGFDTTTSGIRISPPTVEAVQPVNLAGLHNVVAYGEGLFCGGVPEGHEGLATLAAMGVKTVISVDGATPDVATAESLGLQYVHLPFSYSGVSESRRRELAQAITSCEGPIYMHCHHGKHRSAAGLATAMVTAGKLTAAEADARMKVSGTSPNYPGLWQSLQECTRLEAADLKVDPNSLPKVARVTGLVATMSELDVVFDNVKAANGADWEATKDHPDLVPANETKRMLGLFSQLLDDPESQRLPRHYQDQLQAVIGNARELDAAVRGRDIVTANQRYAAVKQACKACHADYRDR
ncbi:MAG: cytochrome c [Planctomycetes bacterium]|nr:cytochrome c [Planctomycetota bacterium]